MLSLTLRPSNSGPLMASPKHHENPLSLFMTLSPLQLPSLFLLFSSFFSTFPPTLLLKHVNPLRFSLAINFCSSLRSPHLINLVKFAATLSNSPEAQRIKSKLHSEWNLKSFPGLHALILASCCVSSPTILPYKYQPPLCSSDSSNLPNMGLRGFAVAAFSD